MLWHKLGKQLLNFSKIALGTEVLQRLNFDLWCELSDGGQCPCSKILHEWSMKIVLVWKLTVLGLAIKRFKLSKNYFYFSNLHIFRHEIKKSLHRFCALQSNTRENFRFSFFSNMVTELLQSKHILLLIYDVNCTLVRKAISLLKIN